MSHLKKHYIELILDAYPYDYCYEDAKEIADGLTEKEIREETAYLEALLNL